MLAILQPFDCDQADSEQGQFPALDELLGSMQRPCMQAPGCLQPAVGCFALELEQDIAALEAEATRCVDTMDWEAPAGDDLFGSCATDMGKALSVDLDSCGRDQASSDEESDDEEWDAPAAGEAPATLPAATRVVRRRGKPVKHGAWQGCCKSAWCDREDRHRGLCNHKATVPGPTATSPQSEDACSTDNQDAECCAHPEQQELSSGGHSHNCSKSQEADGDEREVDSAFKSGAGIQQSPSMQEASMPFSCLPQLQRQPQQQLPPAAQQQQQAEVLCSGSHLAVAEQQEQQLFAMPAMYQPRVKDLEAADISGMLSGEDGLCGLETEATAIAVPVVEPVEMEAGTVEASCHTTLKQALSTPSSPSCVSAAARTESGAFSRPTMNLLLPATLAPAAAVVAVPSSCMRGMLPLEQVHPTISNTAAAAKRAAPATTTAAGAGSPADGGPALKRAKSATAEALLRRCSSSGSSCANDAAAAVAALAAAAPSPASVCKAALSAHKPAALKAAVPPKAPKPAAASAAAAGAGAAATAAVDPKLPPPMARAQRIKQRPRRPDDPPRPLLDLSNSSSLSKISICNKKRPAARMAPAPTTGHSCSQCGATSTPVWRAGPAGPKTLCNACGVRYMKTSKRK